MNGNLRYLFNKLFLLTYWIVVFVVFLWFVFCLTRILNIKSSADLYMATEAVIALILGVLFIYPIKLLVMKLKVRMEYVTAIIILFCCLVSLVLNQFQ